MERELTLRDKINKLLPISIIKWIRLFKFDLEILMMFHSVSKYRDSSNNVLCRDLLINITKIIVNFIIIIVIIIKITTVWITTIQQVTVSAVPTIPLQSWGFPALFFQSKWVSWTMVWQIDKCEGYISAQRDRIWAFKDSIFWLPLLLWSMTQRRVKR